MIVNIKMEIEDSNSSLAVSRVHILYIQTKYLFASMLSAYNSTSNNSSWMHE